MTAAKYTRKGQVQFNETILVLFVVVILLVLGMFFYYKYSIQSLKTASEDLSEEQASVLLAAITSMPEIRCSDEECIDMAKVMAFNRVGREAFSDYARVFGSKRITIEMLYPEPTTIGECTLQKYNSLEYPDNCNYWTIFDNKKSDFENKMIISTPISIYFHEIDEFRIGKIILEVYK